MKKKIFCFTMLILIILALTGCQEDEGINTPINENIAETDKIDEKKADKVTESTPFDDLPEVAHGLGLIEGHYYTNSLDTLLLNYERGFRFFEADLTMTSDQHLVARHDWRPELYQFLGQDYPPVSGPIPLETFISLKIHGKFNPASWEHILKVMQEKPDLYIITDTKDKDKENVSLTFNYLVNAAKQVDPKLLDRIIPQIYVPEMLDYVNEIHDFKYKIYTLYHLTEIPAPEVLADWCIRNNITAIAGLPFRITDELRTKMQENGIIVYTHTINSPDDAAALRAKGIGIYTDYILFNGEEFLEFIQ